MMRRIRQSKGQGLVELALVLPLLLLIVIGTIEFARVFFIYVNISNAAREGSRYGMVNPGDYPGIETRVREMVTLVPPANVDILIRYDHGPDTPEFVDPNSVSPGDRIIVELRYLVQVITPFFEPFLRDGILIQPLNARTIQSVKGFNGGVPNPAPTFTSTPYTHTPTLTTTPKATGTLPPVATSTATNTPIPTRLPPIVIDDPIYAGATSVSGTAAPSQPLTLRVIQTGLVRTSSSDGKGEFSFTGLPALIVGHTVVVQGYGAQDLTIVEGSPTLTPTVPTGPYIYLSPVCGPAGSQLIFIYGRNIPNSASLKTLQFLWDGTQVGTMTDFANLQGAFNVAITVNVTAGAHTVTVNGLDNGGTLILGPLTAPYLSPCDTGPTATATPSTRPDLLIVNLDVTDSGVLGTYETVHLVCSVTNAGSVDVTSLFWVDLYADPAYGVPLAEQSSIDYVAINALEAGSTISFTMYVMDGFTTVGEHELVALVDTWNQIAEENEKNNISSTALVTITVENTPPPPAPPVTPGPTGNIGGTTRLSGADTTQPYVAVYVYDNDGRLWGSTRSDENGLYAIYDLPEGEYVVRAILRLADIIYAGQVGPVTVVGGLNTVGVDIELVEVPDR